MACGCNKLPAQLYTWKGPSGQTVKNLTIVEAKARVNRLGGGYASQ